MWIQSFVSRMRRGRVSCHRPRNALARVNNSITTETYRRCVVGPAVRTQNRPGESTARTTTTHPDHSQHVSMTTTVDHPARDRDLAERFVNDALPYFDQLQGRAHRLTQNTVDAEDLVQETMLRAYVGFDKFSPGTNMRAWLFRIMTNTYINGLRRAQHRPREYLRDHITDRQLAAHDRHSSREARSAELDALDALPDTELANVLATLPMQFRLAVYYRDIVGLRCREIAEIMACSEGTVASRLHRARHRLRILLLTKPTRA